jgi:hypothetical protein
VGTSIIEWKERPMRVSTEHVRRLVTTLVILAAIAFSVLLLVAVLAGRSDGTPAAASRSGDATLATRPSSPVSLPNLNDPRVRQELAKRFEAGSFGIPAPAVAAGPNDVDTDMTNDTCTPRLGCLEPSPNLSDPTTRRRFVCSFAPGSFGISPELPYDVAAGFDCGASDAANTYEERPA